MPFTCSLIRYLLKLTKKLNLSRLCLTFHNVSIQFVFFHQNRRISYLFHYPCLFHEHSIFDKTLSYTLLY